MTPGSCRKGVALAAAAFALAECHPARASRDVAAVISNPTDEGRAELVRVVRRALHDASVTLADDALAHDSTLLVERTPRRDARGLLIDGRETGRPERFSLVKNGADCVLVHERTGLRRVLSSTTCATR